MTPRPVYRWKSFWLGVCVLGFLGWAWVRSNRVEESLSVVAWSFKGDGANAASLSQAWGKIDVAVDADPFGDPGVRCFVREINWELKEPPVLMEFSTGHYSTRLVVSHWFLMMLFLVPWGAWLVWHWRREQRKLGG
jgi:hypothetical protein